jgi:CHAT domain-containing protein
MSAVMHVEEQVKLWLADEVPPELLTTPLPDESAAEVIARLRQEFDRYWYIDPNWSLKYAERIIAIGTARNDAAEIAHGMMAKSDCLAALGSMEEAWDLYDQAGTMFQAAGDEVGWGRTRVGRLYLGPKLNRIPITLAEAEKARAIFTRYGESDRLLRLNWQTALIHNYLGEQHRALELFGVALAVAKSLGEAGQSHIGPLYESIGLTYKALGDFHQALMYYEWARELAVAQHQILSIARIEADIAEIAHAQGQYSRALTLLHGSLERVSVEAPFEAAMIKYHMVECLLALNRYAEARDLARQVVQDCRTFKDAYELSCTLLLLATAEAALGNFDPAYSALVEAESIFTSLNATTWLATTRLWRGRMALKKGDAESARQEAIAAEAVFSMDRQQVHGATATLLRGQALFLLGNLEQAAEAANNALVVAQSYNVPSLRYAAHLVLGQIAEARHHDLRATRYYKAATSTIERVQRGLTITLRPGFLEDKGEAIRALIALQLRSGDLSSAFETLERAKSQVWLGYLINRECLRWTKNDTYSKALIEELDRLRTEHQWFYGIAHNRLKNVELQNAVPREQALTEVAVRERRMRAITDQLYLHSGGGQWDNQAPIFSTTEIQQQLEDHTLLIEYYCDGEALWAFTLDTQVVKAHLLPVTIGDINQLMRMAHNNFSSVLKMAPGSAAAHTLTQQARRILGRLYAWLIEPLEIVKEDARRLIIVPYGVLHTLPFQLLYDGANYLIERFEIVNFPAAGLVTRRGPKRAPGAVALAHSWDGQLFHTYSEAEFVYQQFGGQFLVDGGVRRSVLRREPMQILHIAAHGKYRLDQPEMSYIQFADGQLYTDDVLQQDLSYELVTLSACETGLANVAVNEELIGLGRGFLYAGAGAMIQSLWSVADGSTTELMKRMYTALSNGKSKSAALRYAQTSILEENRDIHPAYWGAFQLLGDDSPLSKPSVVIN